MGFSEGVRDVQRHFYLFETNVCLCDDLRQITTVCVRSLQSEAAATSCGRLRRFATAHIQSTVVHAREALVVEHKENVERRPWFWVLHCVGEWFGMCDVLRPWFDLCSTAKIPVWVSILAPIALGFVIPFWGVLLAPPLLAVVYAYKARLEAGSLGK